MKKKGGKKGGSQIAPAKIDEAWVEGLIQLKYVRISVSAQAPRKVKRGVAATSLEARRRRFPHSRGKDMGEIIQRR